MNTVSADVSERRKWSNAFAHRVSCLRPPSVFAVKIFFENLFSEQAIAIRLEAIASRVEAIATNVARNY